MALLNLKRFDEAEKSLLEALEKASFKPHLAPALRLLV